MKTVQIHNWYRYYGGVDRMYEVIVRMLRHKGHMVTSFEKSSRNINGLKSKIHAFTESIYSGSTREELSSILRSEQPDVVHLHNIDPLISPSVLLACREFNVPVVMRCPDYRMLCPVKLLFSHGEVCDRCKGGQEYWCILRNCRGNFFESIACALQSGIARKLHFYKDNVTIFIPNSEFVKRSLIEAGFYGESIMSIPNMVDIPDTPIDPSDGKYVAYAGRISSEKGIDVLLAAAEQLPHVSVRIAGNGPLLSQLLKKKLKNSTFVGQLNREKLGEFYRKALFLVVPSTCPEPFGLVAAEAMGYGLPVIGSRIGGLPDVVEDGVTGLLFETGNSENLANKMRLLWGNPDLCRKMGQAAREKVIREYREEIYYERLIAVYDKAIKINNDQ